MILRTRPLGEADLLVVLLTPDLGKIPAAARNARKSKRRFPGGLTGGAVGRAGVVQGRGTLLRLDSFAMDYDVTRLGRDLDRFAYVAYLCELTDQLVLERQPDAVLFAELASAIRLVVERPVQATVLRRFELGLLAALGLLPTFDHCCVCGQTIALEHVQAVAFDGDRGGALCPVHGNSADSSNAAPLRAARDLVAADWPSSETGPFAASVEGGSAAERKALRDLTFGAIRRHLRRPLQSLAFFRKLPMAPRETD